MIIDRHNTVTIDWNITQLSDLENVNVLAPQRTATEIQMMKRINLYRHNTVTTDRGKRNSDLELQRSC